LAKKRNSYLEDNPTPPDQKTLGQTAQKPIFLKKCSDLSQKWLKKSDIFAE
jgi:hypothetical protein